MLLVMSVRDIGTDTFYNPICVPTVGKAVRDFSDEVNRQSDDNLFFKHPNDFELFKIGEFNTATGVISPCLPESVVTGKSVRVK